MQIYFFVGAVLQQFDSDTVKRDNNSEDLSDVCTVLFPKYTSYAPVSSETRRVHSSSHDSIRQIVVECFMMNLTVSAGYVANEIGRGTIRKRTLSKHRGKPRGEKRSRREVNGSVPLGAHNDTTGAVAAVRDTPEIGG